MTGLKKGFNTDCLLDEAYCLFSGGDEMLDLIFVDNCTSSIHMR